MLWEGVLRQTGLYIFQVKPVTVSGWEGQVATPLTQACRRNPQGRGNSPEATPLLLSHFRQPRAMCYNRWDEYCPAGVTGPEGRMSVGVGGSTVSGGWGQREWSLTSIGQCRQNIGRFMQWFFSLNYLCTCVSRLGLGRGFQ